MTAHGAPARGPARGGAALLALCAVLAALALGCGGSTSSATDGGGPGGAGTQDAGMGGKPGDAGQIGSGGASAGSGGASASGGSSGTGTGGAATGGASGTGGAGGAMGCMISIEELVVPEPGPTARVRVHGVLSNAGPVPPPLKWSVFSHGQAVAWSMVGDDSTTIEFPATLAGTYDVYAFAATDTRCRGDRMVKVVASCAGCFRFRATPPVVDGLTVPLQEQSVDVDAMAQLLLSAGTRLNIEPRDLVTTELVPAYVRVISPDTGLILEGDTRRAFDAYWLMDKPFDVLVVPFNGAKAPQLFSPAKGLTNFVIDDGIFVLGHAVDGQGNNVGNVQVLLRAGSRPSTIGRSDPRGNFSLLARLGTLSAVIAPPSESGLAEVHVKADENNPGIVLDGIDRTLRIEWTDVVRTPLTVTVTTAAGAPVGGARVRLESPAEMAGVAKVSLYGAAETPLQTQSAPGVVRLEITTDPSGVATFGAVPTGAYRTTVMPPSGTTAGVLTTVTITKTAAAQSQSIVLASAVTLKGTLTPAGATTGARVVARDQGTGLVADESSAVVDQAGAFSLRVAPNRTYRLVAEPPASGKNTFARTVLGASIAVDATPVQTLEARKLSSGRAYPMTVATGEVGLPGFSVQVFCPASSTRCQDPTLPLAEAISDASGRFTVTLPVAVP